MERATIAADILKSAGGEPRGTAIHYAMLLVARDAAVSTGGFNVALSAIDQMGAAYKLGAWNLRFAALEKIAKTAPRSPRLVQLVDVLVSQVDGAAADDRYRIATSLASLAAAKARQTRDKERIRAVANVLTAVRRRKKNYEQNIAPARAALRADPNDPEANLVVGMYEVLQKGRWQQGLPMLAKCSDASIAAAARLDLASPDGAPQQVKVADAWYAAGKAKESQQALQGRAHFWYRMAQGKIGGVDRIVVERRVQETAKFAFRKRLSAGAGALRFGITRASASLRNTESENGSAGVKKKLAFSPDRATLAVNYEHGVRLFDVATGRAKLQLPFDEKLETKSIAYTPGGKELAVGTADGMILIFDAVTGKRRKSFKAHDGWVRALSFSPDGKTLASCSTKRQITFWRTSNWKSRFTTTDRKQDFYDLHFSPDGDAVAVGCRSGWIIVLDSKSGQQRLAFRGHSSSVNCLRYAPNGEILASGSGGRTIRLWNPKTGEKLGTFKGHTRGVQGLAFSPDSRIIASVSGDHSLKLWDTSGTLRETLDGHPSDNRGLRRGAIEFSREGRYLVSCDNATLKFWVPAQP